MKTEPLVTLASITAGATALLGLLVAFGVPLTEGQQVAVLAVVAVAAPFVVALAGRGQVTPNASVVEYVNPASGVVKAGAANELPTDTVVRSLRNNDDDNAGPGAGHVGRLAHGGRVPPKPEKDNGLGRVMLRLKARVLVLLTAFAVVSAGLLGMSAAPAHAAITGCSTGERTKMESGIVYYQGWVVCYGTPPNGKKYYRAKIIYSILGTGAGDMSPSYGKWQQWGNGKKSYGEWVAWPYRSNQEGRQVQVK